MMTSVSAKVSKKRWDFDFIIYNVSRSNKGKDTFVMLRTKHCLNVNVDVNDLTFIFINIFPSDCDNLYSNIAQYKIVSKAMINDTRMCVFVTSCFIMLIDSSHDVDVSLGYMLLKGRRMNTEIIRISIRYAHAFLQSGAGIL